ncbi:hypothetical protein [Nocardia rhizosphaerae]|uniref:DUF8020 domain-containing protein n=1 Tax=Nocardia rhizosphaerae TaxID=1691571 RepID=A0ABV8L4Y6_9NOCA
MRIGTVIGAALLAAGLTLSATGIGAAEPGAADGRPESTPLSAESADSRPEIQLRGVDEEIGYQIALTEDRHSVVTTLDAGRFQLTNDEQVVAITDASGAVIAALPMLVRVGEHTVPLTPVIDAEGARLTLAPDAAADAPLRDISAQERFFAEAQRLQPEIIQGAAIGAAIGFVLGFPLGLFVLDFITVPVATVAGAAIGALAGYAMAGGQPAIDTAIAYVTGAP